MPEFLLYKNDATPVEASGIKDAAGAYINNGTATYTIYQPVEAWPLDTNLLPTLAGSVDEPMSYVAASQGDYTGVVPKTAGDTLTLDARYPVTISVTPSGGGETIEKTRLYRCVYDPGPCEE